MTTKPPHPRPSPPREPLSLPSPPRLPRPRPATKLDGPLVVDGAELARPRPRPRLLSHAQETGLGLLGCRGYSGGSCPETIKGRITQTEPYIHVSTWEAILLPLPRSICIQLQ